MNYLNASNIYLHFVHFILTYIVVLVFNYVDLYSANIFLNFSANAHYDIFITTELKF